jgi:3-isopropylmalate/(R)-2-methylmalate dehydratase small subunit
VSLQPIQRFTARTVALLQDNVDTDQIIPARFLKATTREGLGGALFVDWRARPDFPLNRPEARGAEVLLAGANFGCGSSREHAVWALQDAGFRAVISTAIADIFRANALKNGLLPIVLPAPAHAQLAAAAGGSVTIDLASQTVSLPDGSEAGFTIDPFARYCLLHGQDELDFLLGQAPAIAEFERALPGR